MENERKIQGIDSWARNPLVVGLAIGILAALIQVLLISAGGPEA